MNIYASRFRKMMTERNGSLFQYYVRLPVELKSTQLFEAGDTFDDLFNPSAYNDEEAHVLTAVLGSQSVQVIKGTFTVMQSQI